MALDIRSLVFPQTTDSRLSCIRTLEADCNLCVLSAVVLSTKLLYTLKRGTVR